MLPVITGVKALTVLRAIPMVPMAVTSPTSVVVPVSWRTPVPTCPDPVVVTPCPIPAHPDVSGHWTGRCGLYYWRRYRRLHHYGCGSHQCRDREWQAKVDSDMNSGVYRGESNSRQSQNCDSLFHNIINSTRRRRRTSLQANYRFVSVSLSRFSGRAHGIVRRIAMAWALLN